MTFAITQRFQTEQGWTDSTLLGLMIEYLSNQQSDAALEDFLQQKADFENSEAEGLLSFTPEGVPLLTLNEKLDGFTHCVQEGHCEDALGHMFDLLHYLCPKMTVQIIESGDGVQVHRAAELAYGTAGYFDLLWQSYGRHPTQIRGHNGETEETSGSPSNES